MQLTWDYNYAKADAELGLKGALIGNYDRPLEPMLAARIMVEGMRERWFTGKRLANYLPSTGFATLAQFNQAHRIINETDRASQIAALAAVFQDALADGGWAPRPAPPAATQA